MNLLRTIKLKHLNGDCDEFNHQEKFFLSLFNNLIETKVHSNDNVYYTSPEYDFYFRLDEQQKVLWCSRTNVYEVIKNKFNYKHTTQVDSIIRLTLAKLSINSILLTNIQDAEPALLKRYLQHPE